MKTIFLIKHMFPCIKYKNLDDNLDNQLNWDACARLAEQTWLLRAPLLPGHYSLVSSSHEWKSQFHGNLSVPYTTGHKKIGCTQGGKLNLSLLRVRKRKWKPHLKWRWRQPPFLHYLTHRNRHGILLLPHSILSLILNLEWLLFHFRIFLMALTLLVSLNRFYKKHFKIPQIL